MLPVSRGFEIPSFDGKNAEKWVLQMEDYFEIWNFSEIQKFHVAQNYILQVDKVWDWYRWEKIQNPFISWDQMKLRLLEKFSPKQPPPTMSSFGTLEGMDIKFKEEEQWIKDLGKVDEDSYFEKWRKLFQSTISSQETDPADDSAANSANVQKQSTVEEDVFSNESHRGAKTTSTYANLTDGVQTKWIMDRELISPEASRKAIEENGDVEQFREKQMPHISSFEKLFEEALKAKLSDEEELNAHMSKPFGGAFVQKSVKIEETMQESAEELVQIEETVEESVQIAETVQEVRLGEETRETRIEDSIPALKLKPKGVAYLTAEYLDLQIPLETL